MPTGIVTLHPAFADPARGNLTVHSTESLAVSFDGTRVGNVAILNFAFQQKQNRLSGVQ
ncbi:MAG: hypothetical protein MI685_12635 [Chlorobiales bacterium]|nr:hypothetical protein [Chlorobiales bacterium]